MNLTTPYLGLDLPHPLIPGASPLSDTIDSVRRLEDAGAAAIVLRSLFEEQIERDQMAALQAETHEQSFAEALTYFPTPQSFVFGPDEYLEHLRRVKVAVSIPVIASLNGATPGGWLEYAQLMEHAGADALELNLYRVAFDIALSSQAVEREAVEVVREVVRIVKIPVAVKLSPFYSSLASSRPSSRPAGGEGARALQPLLPARHRPRDPRPEPQPSSLRCPRAAPEAPLAGRPVRPDQGVAGGERRCPQRP